MLPATPGILPLALVGKELAMSPSASVDPGVRSFVHGGNEGRRNETSFGVAGGSVLF